MPPAYDDIGNAYVIVQDGAWHTVSMTTRDATYQTNEQTELDSGDGGFESTWMTLDLSDIAEGDTVLLTIFCKKTEGDSKNFASGSSLSTWRPQLHVFYNSNVTTPVWDPSNPDFGEGDFGLTNFQGYAPSPLSSEHLNPVAGLPYFHHKNLEFETGFTYYLRLEPYGQKVSPPYMYGTAEIGYAVNWTSTTTDVTVDISPDLSIVGSAVQETRGSAPWEFDTPYVDAIGSPYSFRVSGSQLPLPGRYYATVEMKAYSSTPNKVFCTIRRNGYPLAIAMMASDFGRGSLPLSFGERDITSFVPFGGYEDDAYGPSALPVLAGDVYEFAFFNFGFGPSDLPVPFDIQNLKWFPFQTGGREGPEIALLDIPEMPLGAADYNSIQEISHLNNANDSPYNIVDFVVLDDDTIYLMFHADSGASPSNDIVVMTKYTGGTWSLVTNDPFGIGGGGLIPDFFTETGAILQWSMATDGTDIWVVYGVNFAQYERPDQPGAFDPEAHIIVRKYTVGSDTWADVGSPIFPLPSNTCAAQYGSYRHGKPQVSISPGGVPWVTFSSNNPDDPTPFAGAINWTQMVWAYFWNGSAWVDAELPQPVNPHGAGELIDVAVVQDYPRKMVQHTFCGAGGPSENPSVIFMAYYESGATEQQAEWYYQEYGGAPGSWSTTQKFLMSDYFAPGAEYTFRDGEDWTRAKSEAWHQGCTFTHNDDGPILMASLGGSSSYIGATLIIKMVGGEWSAYTRPSPWPANTLPNRPIDAIYLWTDPGGVEGAVMENGLPFCVMDANPYMLAWSNAPLLQPAETGTGDGQAWTCLARTIPLESAASCPPRMVAKGNVLYYANIMDYDINVNGVDLNLDEQIEVWMIPLADEVHIPWVPGIMPIYGSIKRP